MNSSYDYARIPGSDDVRRYVFGDDATCTDETVFSDRYAFQHRHIYPQPNIVTNLDRPWSCGSGIIRMPVTVCDQGICAAFDIVTNFNLTETPDHGSAEPAIITYLDDASGLKRTDHAWTIYANKIRCCSGAKTGIMANVYHPGSGLGKTGQPKES